MKLIIAGTIIMASLLFAAPPGGTLCIDVGTDWDRVTEAFGSIMSLGRPATTAEIESAIFSWVESSTHDYERRQNMSSFTPPPFGNAARYEPKKK